MSKPAGKTGTTAKKKQYEKSLQEWNNIEKLVMTYQAQFQDKNYEEQSKAALLSLLEMFFPLFKKYLVLIKSAQINFNDAETRRFVINFIPETPYRLALKKRMTPQAVKIPITQRFNFVKETYGTLSDEEIINDLHFLFINMARRYKQIGRSFCGYIYQVFCYEVARHIKKFIENPANIYYRNVEYDDFFCKTNEDAIVEEQPFENKLFEDSFGIPDSTWISGLSCSEIFEQLTPLERKLIVKYYLEDYNDKQIAEKLGLHVSVVNVKRHAAIEFLAGLLKINQGVIKRNRRHIKK